MYRYLSAVHISRRRLLAGAAAGGWLAACGPTGQRPSAGAPTPPPRLSLSAYADPVGLKVYEKIKERFEQQHAGSQVELVMFPAALGTAGVSLAEKVIAMVASGTPPDVFLTIAQLKPQWVKRGMLLDLTARVNRSAKVKPSMYYPPVVDAMRQRGRFYGTPWGYNSMLMYLNADLFQHKGVPLPKTTWTYDDYADIARRLTDAASGVFGALNHGNGSTNPAFALLFNHAGHYWVDEQETKALVDSSGSIAMHEFWLRLQNGLKVTPSREQPLPSGRNERSGNVAMWLSWSTEPIFLKDAQEKSGNVFKWRLHTWPKGPRAQTHFAQGHLWSIATNHARQDQAWTLAEWMGGLEAEKVWAEQRRTPPQVPDDKLWQLYFGQLPPAEQKEAIDFIVKTLYGGGFAKDFQYWATYDDCRQVMAEEVRTIYVTGEKSPREAMTTAAQRINAILAANH